MGSSKKDTKKKVALKKTVPKKTERAVNTRSVGTDLPGIVSQESFTKKLADTDIFVMKCPTPACGGIHFRHAGYLEVLMPIVDPRDGAKVYADSEPVKICVKCKRAHIMYKGKIIDVTDNIDLSAWINTELKAQNATGPGGQC